MNKTYKIISIIVLILTLGAAIYFASPYAEELVGDAGSHTSHSSGGGGSSSHSSSSHRSSSSSSSSSGGGSIDFDDFTWPTAIFTHILMSFHSFLFFIMPLSLIIENITKKKYKNLIGKLFVARIIIVFAFDFIKLGSGVAIDMFSLYIGIFLFIIASVSTPSKKKTKITRKELPLEVLQKYGIENTQLLKEQLFNVFKEIEIAWMDFDYINLQRYCTDELYNTYKSQLEGYKLKNEQNIMCNFKYINCIPYKITTENNVTNLYVILNIEMNDYIVDYTTKKLKKGSKKTIYNMTYDMTFVKQGSKKPNFCTNCGAKVDINEGTKCSYCNSQIVFVDSNWQMSEKQLLKQINK